MTLRMAFDREDGGQDVKIVHVGRETVERIQAYAAGVDYHSPLEKAPDESVIEEIDPDEEGLAEEDEDTDLDDLDDDEDGD